MVRQKQVVIAIEYACERRIPLPSGIRFKACVCPLHAHAFDAQADAAGAAVRFDPLRPVIGVRAEPMDHVHRPRRRNGRLTMNETEHLKKRQRISPAGERDHPSLSGNVDQRRRETVLQACYRVHDPPRQPATRS